jgi:hypothetical protein
LGAEAERIRGSDERRRKTRTARHARAWAASSHEKLGTRKTFKARNPWVGGGKEVMDGKEILGKLKAADQLSTFGASSSLQAS